MNEFYEKNPLSAINTDALPPSLINKLRTEPNVFVGRSEALREKYERQNQEKLQQCREKVERHAASK